VTFFACSRGVFPLVSNHDCTFATVSSWVIAGGSTAIVIRVAPLIPPNAKPLFLNSAIPSMAASYREDAGNGNGVGHICAVRERYPADARHHSSVGE
jgi:hypothetical protein